MSKVLSIIKTVVQCSQRNYSKHQCTKLATKIGKELVDYSKLGNEISKETVQCAIKKHAPKLDIDIIDNIDDLQRIGKLSKTEVEIYEHINHYNGNCGYIYLAGNLNNSIPIIAHECEHALFGENTFIMKLIKKCPQKEINGKTIEDTNNFEMLLKEYCNLDSLTNNNYKTLKEYLQSDNFVGLSSTKRIDAYIRAISRHCANPKNGKNAAKLYGELFRFKDETRAHEVSKLVAEYENAENIGLYNVLKELYNRTYDILKKEFFIALGNIRKTEKVITSLPTNASKKQQQKFNFFLTKIRNDCQKGKKAEIKFTDKELFGLDF